MACEDEKNKADEAADALDEAMNKADQYSNDVTDSYGDYVDANNDFWDSIGSEDPDAAEDAYNGFKFSEDKLANDFDAYGDAMNDAVGAYDGWNNAYKEYCECAAKDAEG